MLFLYGPSQAKSSDGLRAEITQYVVTEPTWITITPSLIFYCYHNESLFSTSCSLVYSWHLFSSSSLGKIIKWRPKMDLTLYWRRSKQPDWILSLTWFRRFHKRLLNPILDEIASDRNLFGKRWLINPSKSSILHRALWAEQPNPTLKSTAYIVCHPEKAFRQLYKELCVFSMRNMSNL